MLITDRTRDDVLLGNEKGVYGCTDLNRVEQAVADIGAAYPRLGYGDIPVTKTDWGLPGDFSPESWPTQAQMDRYLANVRRIRDRFCSGASLPLTMAGLDWQGANEIEKALDRAQRAVQGIEDAWRYSGELYAGEERCV